MNDPTMETLARRVDRLERENRRLMRAGVAVLALIAAVVLMGQATASKVAKVVEAEKFVLRDRAGKMLAKLGAAPGGWAGLSLYDNDTKIRAGLAVGPDGSSALWLYPKHGKPIVSLRARADNSAALSFADEAGRSLAALAVEPDGSSALALSQKAGKGGAMLSILPHGPDLTFYDKAGKVIWSTP